MNVPVKTLYILPLLPLFLVISLGFLGCQSEPTEFKFYEDPDPIVAPPATPPGILKGDLPLADPIKKDAWENVPEKQLDKASTKPDKPSDAQDLKVTPEAKKPMDSAEASSKAPPLKLKTKPKKSKVTTPGDAAPLRKALPVKKTLDNPLKKPIIDKAKKTEKVIKTEKIEIKIETPEESKKNLEPPKPLKKSDTIRQEALQSKERPSPPKTMAPVILEPSETEANKPEELPPPPKLN